MCGSNQSKLSHAPTRLKKREKNKSRWLEEPDDDELKEIEMRNQDNLMKTIRGTKSSYVGDDEDMNQWKAQAREQFNLNSESLLAMDNLGAEIREKTQEYRDQMNTDEFSKNWVSYKNLTISQKEFPTIITLVLIHFLNQNHFIIK